MSLPPPRNILIVRLSAIGDVVHALPCLHALRVAFPRARIGWVVEELSAQLLRDHPEIDQLFVIPKKRWRAHPLRAWLNGDKPAFYRQLRAIPWDVAVDFQGLTKSAIPAWLSGAPARIGFGDRDGRELNKLFTNIRVVPPADQPHIIQRNLALLRPLGIVDPPVEWRFPDLAAERDKIDAELARTGIAPADGFIGLYPGAGWETKRWPTAHFADLARLLADAAASPRAARFPIRLIWGPGEENLCRGILEAAALPADRFCMAPPTNLRELAALLGRARVIVGGDTGPVHLAAALRIPVAGIYGGSDPVRNGPWGFAQSTLLADRAPCTVCWRTRCNREPFLECMTRLAPERVRASVERILENETPDK